MLMSNKFVWFYFRSHYSKLDFAISLESKSGREKNVSPHYLTLSLFKLQILQKNQPAALSSIPYPVYVPRGYACS